MHHQFMGFFIDEWASLFTIGIALGGIIAGVMRVVLMPLKNSIDRLGDIIKGINDATKNNSNRLDTLEDRFEEHIGEAKVRNQRITSLEHEVYNRKRDK